MQEAIPFRAYIPGATAGNRSLSPTNAHAPPVAPHASNGPDYVKELVSENSVIVFGKRGCCMCHVVKRLLLGLGVNPAVIDVDEREEDYVMKELSVIHKGDHASRNSKEGELIQFPVVFVGGKKFGGLERVMATHISGELVPILKDAGALWL